MQTFEQIEARIDVLAQGQGDAVAAAGELVQLGEDVFAQWLIARGEVPTQDSKEGFRLLALQRQGCKGEASFNACRETARELAYAYNLISQAPDGADASKRVKLAAMVAKHLCLFVSGKMQVAELGEFCCSSRPLRAHGG